MCYVTSDRPSLGPSRCLCPKTVDGKKKGRTRLDICNPFPLYGLSHGLRFCHSRVPKVRHVGSREPCEAANSERSPQPTHNRTNVGLFVQKLQLTAHVQSQGGRAYRREKVAQRLHEGSFLTETSLPNHSNVVPSELIAVILD